MSLALLFHYLMLNMFRMLIHPSSGVCDLFVELFRGLYCSGTMLFGWGGVVSGCRLKPEHTSYQSNTTHEITQQISRKLLRMDVLTSETCSALNNEIIKQVTSNWSLYLFNYEDDARSNKHKIHIIVYSFILWAHILVPSRPLPSFPWSGLKACNSVYCNKHYVLLSTCKGNDGKIILIYVHLILGSHAPLLKTTLAKFCYLTDTRQSEKHFLYFT